MMDELDTEVRAALDRRRGNWRLIAMKAGISHSWISQFVRHKIPNPGYATLRRLRVVMIDDPLIDVAVPTPGLIGELALSLEAGLDATPEASHAG